LAPNRVFKQPKGLVGPRSWRTSSRAAGHRGPLAFAECSSFQNARPFPSKKWKFCFQLPKTLVMSGGELRTRYEALRQWKVDLKLAFLKMSGILRAARVANLRQESDAG
jgi:hypothetical protein